jgi:hypothetical protein
MENRTLTVTAFPTLPRAHGIEPGPYQRAAEAAARRLMTPLKVFRINLLHQITRHPPAIGTRATGARAFRFGNGCTATDQTKILSHGAVRVV